MFYLDRPLLESLFPVDYGSYFPGHETKIDDPQLVVMVEAGDAGVFSEPLWNLLSEIDSLVISHPGYTTTCARSPGKAGDGRLNFDDSVVDDDYHVDDVSECVGNDFLELRTHLDAVRSRAFNLSFPLTINPATSKQYFLQMHFGGVSIERDAKGMEVLSNAKVIRLSYPLDPSCAMAAKVEKELWNAMSTFATTNNFSILFVHSQSIKEELQTNLHQVRTGPFSMCAGDW